MNTKMYIQNMNHCHIHKLSNPATLLCLQMFVVSFIYMFFFGDTIMYPPIYIYMMEQQFTITILDCKLVNLLYT